MYTSIIGICPGYFSWFAGVNIWRTFILSLSVLLWSEWSYCATICQPGIISHCENFQRPAGSFYWSVDWTIVHMSSMCKKQFWSSWYGVSYRFSLAGKRGGGARGGGGGLLTTVHSVTLTWDSCCLKTVKLRVPISKPLLFLFSFFSSIFFCAPLTGTYFIKEKNSVSPDIASMQIPKMVQPLCWVFTLQVKTCNDAPVTVSP